MSETLFFLNCHWDSILAARFGDFGGLRLDAFRKVEGGVVLGYDLLETMADLGELEPQC